MILSVSRRTDIPAFYSKWFINRIREGYVYVKNPFNANQISNIPLGENVIDCIVFWTKNPEPLLEYLPEINEKYHGAFYFQYTINGYENDIEPGVPLLDKRIDTFVKIAEEYGPDRVVWRYDPIFINEKYSIQWHLDAFKHILDRLKGHTDTCVISFIDMYAKTQKNTSQYGIRELSRDEIHYLALEMCKIVKDSGIQIKTCAESIDLNEFNISHNCCIDQTRIESITGFRIKAKPDKQRKDCMCIECADIGLYNTCLHGCRYCYANYNSNRVEKALAEHDDNSPLLTGTLGSESVITNYTKAKSLKTGIINNDQLNIFNAISMGDMT